MSIQFLDERISIAGNDATGTEIIASVPLLIGDIGLQTGAAAAAGNAASVRVQLNGTVSVFLQPKVTTTIAFAIERNGASDAGTGTLIWTQLFNPSYNNSLVPLSVAAADFPPAADVVAGQIRYTLFITAKGDPILNGPIVFYGTATAGSTS
jgi:hypothetical protein